MLIALFAVACSGTADSTGKTGETTTDSTTTTSETTQTTPACTEVTTGDNWAWYGECPQMKTPCVVTFTDCSVTVEYPGGMTMDMPTGGTIEGNTITFAGGKKLNCVGTIEDGENISGTCDGCTFTLTKG